VDLFPVVALRRPGRPHRGEHGVVVEHREHEYPDGGLVDTIWRASRIELGKVQVHHHDVGLQGEPARPLPHP
jgi:hypothetical protein